MSGVWLVAVEVGTLVAGFHAGLFILFMSTGRFTKTNMDTEMGIYMAWQSGYGRVFVGTLFLSTPVFPDKWVNQKIPGSGACSAA